VKKRVKKPVNREEDQLQKMQVEYLEILRAQGRLEYFAVPNGGLRSPREAAIMKGLGTRAGVLDLVILWSIPFGGPQGTPLPAMGFIENKSEKGVLSLEQKAWIQWLTGHGHRTAVVRTFSQFLQTLEDWRLISTAERGAREYAV